LPDIDTAEGVERRGGSGGGSEVDRGFLFVFFLFFLASTSASPLGKPTKKPSPTLESPRSTARREGRTVSE
jgi:hypothetical protein